MLHQKEVEEVQNMIDDMNENEAEKRILSSKTCSSAVLASQIKKIIPSKVFDNHISSIAAGLEKINEATQKMKSKIAEKQSLSEKDSHHASESQMKEILIPETKAEAVDPEIIKILPVPLSQKKLFRDTLTLPPSKVPWSDKLMTGVKYNYNDISYKFELWQNSLKEIEGYFGAGTVSYFLFLRWLLMMNCFMMVLIFSFLVLPTITLSPKIYSLPANFTIASVQDISLSKEIFSYLNPLYKVLEGDVQSKPSFKSIISNQSKESAKEIVKYCHKKYIKLINEARRKGFIADIQNLVQGTGWMEPTIMFLGNYPILAVSSKGLVYNVALAFILVFFAIYLLCFIMMMLYSSIGIYEAVMTKTDFSNRFANDVFSAWDYCIKDRRNAKVHHKSFTNNLKATLSEIEYQKEAAERSRRVWMKLYCIRVVVNLFIFAWIALCYYIIYTIVHFQLKQDQKPYQAGIKTLIIQFSPAITVTTIRKISPLFFSALAPYEKFHARTAVNLALARSTFLGLSSVFVLVASFQRQILCKPVDICGRGKDHCHAPMCWETYVGQELYKLNFSEFLLSLLFSFLNFAGDYMKKKYDNRFTRWLFAADFFLPKEILTLIYLQTITWLGVLYSPLLPLTLIIKFIVLFYTKKNLVMKFAKPSTTIYKASRFNSMYIFLLMVSFLIVLAVQFYTLTKVVPSYGCSPFRFYDAMINALEEQLRKIPCFIELWRTLLSGWFFLLAFIILWFVIYCYWTKCSMLKVSEKKLTDDLVLLGEDRKFLLNKIAKIVEDEKKEKSE